MSLAAWAVRWGVSPVAIADLRASLGAGLPAEPPVTPGLSEAAVLSQIRVEASRKGLRLWRNNLGAVTDAHGNYIRYGLANDSKALNAMCKSSDLIGIRPGGQFVAREIKAPGWKYTGTPRERAQLKFLELVASYGGDACFATSEGTL